MLNKDNRFCHDRSALENNFPQISDSFHQHPSNGKLNSKAMKKLTLFLVCAVVGGAAYAQNQTEMFTAKAVKKGEEPQAVVDAINQDFPKAIVGDLNVIPAKLYGEKWAVNFDDRSNGTPAEYYHVSLKEGKSQYSAYYNKDGKLISSKTYLSNAQLPSEVTSAINSKYADWTIVKDSEKMAYRDGKVKEAYHVEIQRDKKHRNLLIDNSGKVLKDTPQGHSK